MQTDVNLLLQFIVIVLLIVGFYGRKRKAKRHLVFMIVATVLEMATFLEFMGPIFFDNINFFFTAFTTPLVAAFLIHAFTGSAALVLAFVLIALWAVRGPSTASCYRRKRAMLWTTAIWVVSISMGVVGYILAYVA